MTFFPLQSLHLSFSLITSPSPLQSGHVCWSCWIIGPICLMMILMPLPLHDWHVLDAPSFPPLPSHLGQMICFCRASLDTLPRYRSSRETLSACAMSLPFRGPLC